MANYMYAILLSYYLFISSQHINLYNDGYFSDFYMFSALSFNMTWTATDAMTV